MKILTFAALALFIAGLFVVLFNPFPACAYYVNLILFQYCGEAITIFGLNPNVFASVAFFAIGAIVLIMSRRRGR